VLYLALLTKTVLCLMRLAALRIELPPTHSRLRECVRVVPCAADENSIVSYAARRTEDRTTSYSFPRPGGVCVRSRGLRCCNENSIVSCAVRRTEE